MLLLEVYLRANLILKISFNTLLSYEIHQKLIHFGRRIA